MDKELFKLNEDGLYDFIGNEKDILWILEDYFDDVNSISPVHRHNDEYIIFHTYRKDEIDIELEMKEHDEVYISYDGQLINFTYSQLVFFKVKNLEEPEEFIMYIPYEFNNDKVLVEYYNKYDQLFLIANTIDNTFIDLESVKVSFLNKLFGDKEDCLWSRYAFDDYCKDLAERYSENHFFLN